MCLRTRERACAPLYTPARLGIWRRTVTGSDQGAEPIRLSRVRAMQQLQPLKTGRAIALVLYGKRWTPWTLGHSGHRPMHRCPRYRAAAGAQRPLSWLKARHTTANLASGGVCSTARFKRHELLLRMACHLRPVLSVVMIQALPPGAVVRLARKLAKSWGVPNHGRARR